MGLSIFAMTITMIITMTIYYNYDYDYNYYIILVITNHKSLYSTTHYNNPNCKTKKLFHLRMGVFNKKLLTSYEQWQ